MENNEKEQKIVHINRQYFKDLDYLKYELDNGMINYNQYREECDKLNKQRQEVFKQIEQE